MLTSINFSALPSFDTLIVQFSHLNEAQMDQLKTMRLTNASTNFIFLANSQENCRTLLRDLDNDFGDLWQVTFDNPKPKMKDHMFSENAIFGVCSIPVVQEPPIKSYNGPLKNLSGLVQQVTVPNSNDKTLYVNMTGMDFVKIDSAGPVEYIGNKFSLNRFSKFMNSSNSKAEEGEVTSSNSVETDVIDVSEDKTEHMSETHVIKGFNESLETEHVPGEGAIEDSSSLPKKNCYFFSLLMFFFSI